jgi:hypothetical protein
MTHRRRPHYGAQFKLSVEIKKTIVKNVNIKWKQNIMANALNVCFAKVLVCQVYKVVRVKTDVFWNMTPCSLAKV